MKSLFVVLLTVAAVTADKTLCEPGSSFKMDCNTCICSDDGKLAACTEILCLEREQVQLVDLTNDKVDSKMVCEPKSKFKDYCNTCGCATDGLSFACTRMMCDPEIWNKDGSLKAIPKHHRLTRSASKQVCEPGTQFNDYCNTCGCANDGLSYICTRRICSEEIWNKDGSLKIATTHHGIKRSAEKQVCTPRSHFNDYCNTCTCSEDGSTFGCTMMMCDENIWNQDGTLKLVRTLSV